MIFKIVQNGNFSPSKMAKINIFVFLCEKPTKISNCDSSKSAKIRNFSSSKGSNSKFLTILVIWNSIKLKFWSLLKLVKPEIYAMSTVSIFLIWQKSVNFTMPLILIHFWNKKVLWKSWQKLCKAQLFPQFSQSTFSKTIEVLIQLAVFKQWKVFHFHEKVQFSKLLCAILSKIDWKCS